MSKKINFTKEEIIKRYDLVKKIEKEGMPIKKYCRIHGLSASETVDIYFSVRHLKKNNPKKYACLMKHIAPYRNSGLSLYKIIKNLPENIKFTLSDVQRFMVHLKVLDALYEYGLEDRPKNEIKSEDTIMKDSPAFIQVSPKTPDENYDKQYNIESVVVKNELELIIPCGIKVTISQAIDSEKLIKIIEFLRGI